MDVLRFAKLPPRANDPTRRYQLVTGSGPDQKVLGRLELTGDAADGDTLHLALTCTPDLTDAARQDVLDTARRFVNELAANWGRQAAEAGGEVGWEPLPDGKLGTRLTFTVV
jgi:hypothetical protein